MLSVILVKLFKTIAVMVSNDTNTPHYLKWLHLLENREIFK